MTIFADEITDDEVSLWIKEITRKALTSSGNQRKEDRKLISGKLSAMRPTTVFYIREAVRNSSSDKLLRGLMRLAAMGAEESLRSQALFWEVDETFMSSSVNQHMVFKYVDAPSEDDISPVEMKPYVAKAIGLCALANAFWLVTGNVNRVREIEEMYPEFISLFVQNPDRATEMANLMAYRKASSVEHLQYHLNLHPAVGQGAL